ncbi:MAG TPA: nucleotidyltransferase family protein [Candidatus Acidoferrales bacterium]|nr:nucleotidyltransferase family protein [Candidatus Acidoferrales bacterium]
MGDHVKALVVAGGEGTRLRPISYYIQKCMIPLGPKQKPLLEYIIRLLRLHDVKDIVLSVGYKAEQIVNYFDNGSRFGVDLTYAYDENTYRGSGSALVNAFRRNVFTENDSLLVYYGDILSNINLSEMLSAHKNKDADITLALSKGYQIPKGIAQVKGERIVQLVEKPSLNILVDMGVVAIEPSVLKTRMKEWTKQHSLDLMGEILPTAIQGDLRVFPYVTDAFWYDIGSAEAYEKLDFNAISPNIKEIQ